MTTNVNPSSHLSDEAVGRIARRLFELPKERDEKRAVEIERIAAEFTYGDQRKAAQDFINLLADKPRSA